MKNWFVEWALDLFFLLPTFAFLFESEADQRRKQQRWIFIVLIKQHAAAAVVRVSAKLFIGHLQTSITVFLINATPVSFKRSMCHEPSPPRFILVITTRSHLSRPKCSRDPRPPFSFPQLSPDGTFGPSARLRPPTRSLPVLPQVLSAMIEWRAARCSPVTQGAACPPGCVSDRWLQGLPGSRWSQWLCCLVSAAALTFKLLLSFKLAPKLSAH